MTEIRVGDIIEYKEIGPDAPGANERMAGVIGIVKKAHRDEDGIQDVYFYPILFTGKMTQLEDDGTYCASYKNVRKLEKTEEG